MPGEFFDLTTRFMRDPIKILVKTDQLTLEGIKQYYINEKEMNLSLIQSVTSTVDSQHRALSIVIQENCR